MSELRSSAPNRCDRLSRLRARAIGLLSLPVLSIWWGRLWNTSSRASPPKTALPGGAPARRSRRSDGLLSWCSLLQSVGIEPVGPAVQFLAVGCLHRNRFAYEQRLAGISGPKLLIDIEFTEGIRVRRQLEYLTVNTVCRSSVEHSSWIAAQIEDAAGGRTLAHELETAHNSGHLRRRVVTPQCAVNKEVFWRWHEITASAAEHEFADTYQAARSRFPCCFECMTSHWPASGCNQDNSRTLLPDWICSSVLHYARSPITQRNSGNPSIPATDPGPSFRHFVSWQHSPALLVSSLARVARRTFRTCAQSNVPARVVYLADRF